MTRPGASQRPNPTTSTTHIGKRKFDSRDSLATSEEEQRARARARARASHPPMSSTSELNPIPSSPPPAQSASHSQSAESGSQIQLPSLMPHISGTNVIEEFFSNMLDVVDQEESANRLSWVWKYGAFYALVGVREFVQNESADVVDHDDNAKLHQTASRRRLKARPRPPG